MIFEYAHVKIGNCIFVHIRSGKYKDPAHFNRKVSALAGLDVDELGERMGLGQALHHRVEETSVAQIVQTLHLN